MKRYRVVGFDFDTSTNFLTDPIPDEWEERVKEQHRQNRDAVLQRLKAVFGEEMFEAKLYNVKALGSKPFSILAYHNQFFEQIRTAFIMGAYYPALTAACALGERILTYMMLNLRDDFKRHPEYKKVYRRESFENWDLAIDTLEAWDVLLPEAVIAFRELRERRNRAIHFRPEVDQNAGLLAFEAINTLHEIISKQFSAAGPQPWFLHGVPGEIYIKKEWEDKPFVRRVYLPNCLRVGPRHIVEEILPVWKINDVFEYEDRDISDAEFCELRVRW